jgi:hypothetical protein
MARDFPDLKVGDELRIWHLRIIYDELRRWRKMRGAGLVDVDDADGTSPPTIVGYAASGLIPAQLTSGIAAGSLASPATAAGTLLVPTGTSGGLTATGGAAITIINIYATAVTGSNKTCWVSQLRGFYYLIVADC